GKIRALSNVCRHRAGPVACGAGEKKSFQCGYHGWTYALDGALLHAREFEGVECFTGADSRLPEFKTAQLGSLIFANLSGNAPSAAEVFEDLPAELARRIDFSRAAPL